MDLKQKKARTFSSSFHPHFSSLILLILTHVCVCVCCVAETRHTYPRLERKPAAIPERDGKCYSIRVPDPAVHSLVPEPHLLRPGLAGPLQGRPTGFQGFVSLRLIYIARLGSLPRLYDSVLLFRCWPDSDFII